MKIHRRTILFALASLLLLPGTGARAETVKKTLCVYDPSGAMGDAFNLMKDYRNAAVAWGVDFELVPYTDEKTAAEDLKAGKCDVALLTGVRARLFNKFSGSIEAMGAIKSYEQLKKVVQLLANPKAGKKMQAGGYETVGIFPAGAVYMFLRDRTLEDVGDLAGKRIATLDFDEAAVTMVDRAGASMVPADIGTFAGMFNNGSVDIAYAPATAYGPLELHKGLGKKGAVVRYPLAQLTLQLLARSDAGLPPGFADASRNFAAKHFDKVLKLTRRAEQQIPKRYWKEVPPEKAKGYDALFREVRIQLRDKGVYDKTMLTLLRRVRCKDDPARAECAEKRE
ncbi:MAG: hypothetical protein D6729_07400 [Deltaproteobacteria bacterium]|nr:MAG: hypothetical protein D6729_07400 [Deltaproteobacteria bacterium]